MRICHIYIYMRLYNVPNWVHLTDPISKRIGKKNTKIHCFYAPKITPSRFSIGTQFQTSMCQLHLVLLQHSNVKHWNVVEHEQTCRQRGPMPRDAPLREFCNKPRKIELQVEIAPGSIPHQDGDSIAYVCVLHRNNQMIHNS